MTDKNVLYALEALHRLTAAGAKSGPAWTAARANVLSALQSHDVRSAERPKA